MTTTSTPSRRTRNQRVARSDMAMRDPARLALIAGLGLGALGLIIEVITGVPGFPTIPPGPIIMAAAATFVALARWRWAPIVGLIAALFITVGNVVSDSDTTGRLSDPGAVGPFAGTVLLVVGLLIALVAGSAASVRALRHRTD
jgi:hypothetical protein